MSKFSFAIGLLLIASAARVASSQIAGAPFCSNVVFDQSPPPTTADLIERMHPLISRARYADAVRDGEWVTAIRGLRDDAMQAFVEAHLAPAQQTIVSAQIDSVLDALARLPAPADASRARYIADSVRSVRFLPIAGVDAYHLFRRPQIDVALLPVDQQRALCWSALSFDLVLFRLSAPLEGGSIARLARLGASWANYRTYGYTRQPLELALFRGSPRDSLPPTTQWLIGHLSLGVEVSGHTADSLASESASVIELGVLRYRSNYTQYAGISAIAGIASRGTVGFGGMLHVARSVRGGMLFRRESGQLRHSFVLSTDLYGMLDRSKRSVDEGAATARGIVVLPPR